MVEPSDPHAAPPGAPGAPPKQGMSTGVKIAIGCGVLLVLVIVGFVVITAIGGMFLKNKAEDLTGGLEAQEEASQTIQSLEQEHPFTPPSDGVVSDDLAEQFFSVTDDAWERMREDMEEMGERDEAIDERGGEAGFGDVMAGVGALGRSRVALAEALEANDMPVSAYLWTGMALVQAYHALSMPPEQSGVPPQNLELAESHRAELAEIADSGQDGRPGKGAVLGMAWTWGASEGTMPAGWDTMNYNAP